MSDNQVNDTVIVDGYEGFGEIEHIEGEYIGVRWLYRYRPDVDPTEITVNVSALQRAVKRLEVERDDEHKAHEQTALELVRMGLMITRLLMSHIELANHVWYGGIAPDKQAVLDLQAEIRNELTRVD